MADGQSDLYPFVLLVAMNTSILGSVLVVLSFLCSCCFIDSSSLTMFLIVSSQTGDRDWGGLNGFKTTYQAIDGG